MSKSRYGIHVTSDRVAILLTFILFIIVIPYCIAHKIYEYKSTLFPELIIYSDTAKSAIDLRVSVSSKINDISILIMGAIWSVLIFSGGRIRLPKSKTTGLYSFICINLVTVMTVATHYLFIDSVYKSLVYASKKVIDNVRYFPSVDDESVALFFLMQIICFIFQIVVTLLVIYSFYRDSESRFESANQAKGDSK